MVGPIRTFFELAQKSTRALVSARKAIAIFEQRPPWREPADPQPLDGAAEIVDDLSGFTARPGLLTVVVSAVPEQSAALADRLGRYLPPDTDPVGEDDGDGLKGRAARRARADRERRRARIAARDEEARPAAVGGPARRRRPVRRRALDDVRRQVLVSDTGSELFAGTLQDAIDPHGRLTREQAEAALRVANAEDVYDALPEGWQGQLDERGRGLSGGQRQRVVLARALAADAPILVLVEPTSAVDAHTEARIAERVERPAPRPDDRRLHRLAAVAAPRRPGGAARRRRVVADGDARRPARERRRPTAPWWPARSTTTRRWPDDDRPAGHLAPTPGATGRLDAAASVPPELVRRSTRLAGGARLARLAARHDLRRQRAEDVYDARATPSAAGRSRATARCSRSSATWCRAAAGCSPRWSCSTRSPPAAGLVVPRLLGELVNTHRRRRRPVARHARAGWSSAWCCSQAAVDVRGAAHVDPVRPGPARRRPASTSCAPILRLPLGAVESASTGDLVTRVTRDVGTMSRAVQYGLPMAIIALLTVVLSVGAMLLNSVLLALPALLMFATCVVGRTPLPAAGAEGLHHRGRDLLADQHDAHRDRRGRAYGRGARACPAPGCGPATTTSRSRPRRSATA